MSYNSKYFDRKPGSLENAVLEALGGQINETNKNDKSDDGEGMDAVQPKAVKKKFDDRKDKDIDNDGDVDSSDKFLHKRRKAISKAVSKEEKDDFKPHMMYDPKTGKGYKADTMDDHLRMKKMGYGHEAPKNESTELGEGKMKELAGKIATVYKKMKSDSKMKPFADKFRADVKTSMNIRKSLEKVLPDYVAGGDITKLVESGHDFARLKRAAAAAKAKADKSAGRASTASKAGLSRVSDKESDKEGKARDQETKFARAARAAKERDTEKAMQKGVLGKKGTSAKSVEKSRRKDVAFDAGPGKEKGSVAGVDRNVQRSKDAYTKYKEKGGGLSRDDYMKKVGSRLKREETEDWNEVVSIMQEKNDTMRQALAKMWGVEEGRNHNPFGEAADFKPHKMYDPKTGEAHDAKTMDDHLRMKKMGYTHTEPKKEQKTMTGQPATKVTVDPDMKEKKNIA